MANRSARAAASCSSDVSAGLVASLRISDRCCSSSSLVRHSIYPPTRTLLSSVVYCIDLIDVGSIPYQPCQSILKPSSRDSSLKRSPQRRIQKLSALSPNFAPPFRSTFDWPKNPWGPKSWSSNDRSQKCPRGPTLRPTPSVSAHRRRAMDKMQARSLTPFAKRRELRIHGSEQRQCRMMSAIASRHSSSDRP
jgi:hypothetical protein